jgi:hypothetical protein
MPRHFKSEEERVAAFWRKVKKDANDKGCWEWQGYRHPQGRYGYLKVAGNKTAKAHRYSWELHNGPIPEGADVLHTCDNPPCIRPSHLFLGDDMTNAADRSAKGRSARNMGTKNGRAKLTEDDVRYIRCNPDHLTQKELAARFRVASSLISFVVNRVNWKHVE